MSYKKSIYQYMDDVQSGTIPACEYTKLAVERYHHDQKFSIELGIKHDAQAAERVINFFAKLLWHTKGSQFAGKRFILEPWQMFIIWNLFGWKRTNGQRRFRQSYVEIARKNGKSAFAGGIGLYMMRKDNEPSAEVYSAATTRDQAKLVFDQAGEMVRKSIMKKDVDVMRNSIYVKPGSDPIASGSFFKAVSSEANTLDGLNPHMAIIDEFHAHKTLDVFNVFADALGARTNPMIFSITTAGYNREAPCYRYRKNCIDILKGIKKDESLFSVIYTKDDADDWQDESTWVKSNPNLDVSINKQFLKDQAVKAKNNTDQLNSFLTKNLNIWTDSVTAWIPDDAILKAMKTVPVEKLRTGKLYAGLDLASTSDFNALVLLFVFEDKTKHAVPFFWVPSDTVKTRDHIAAYSSWVHDKHLLTTDGNVVDHLFIVNKANELHKQYGLVSLAYDRALAYHGAIQEMVKANIPVTPFAQNIQSVSVPTKELEKEILSGQLTIEPNPVMRWMFSNVAMYRDSNDNVRVHKGKSQGKVDGVAALVMALGEYMEKDNKAVVTPTIRFL